MQLVGGSATVQNWDLGVGPMQGSVEYFQSGSTWSISISLGPGGAVGYSRYQTKTSVWPSK